MAVLLPESLAVTQGLNLASRGAPSELDLPLSWTGQPVAELVEACSSRHSLPVRQSEPDFLWAWGSVPG